MFMVFFGFLYYCDYWFVFVVILYLGRIDVYKVSYIG